MIRFCYSLAPNPMKVASLLEEAESPHEPVPVDSQKGQQTDPKYGTLNPESKVSCIVDGNTTAPFPTGDGDVRARLPDLKRFLDEINARPAAGRATVLRDRHASRSRAAGS